jgi:threonylcarbamoyladenosine tRNA methylthiotransferase MtaB
MPGVTQVLGNESKRLLSFSGDYSSSGGPVRTRTFFKIQDGCDYFCTYCAIPFARGRSRSATIEETLCAARHIASSGAKEVILTGVNTGTFGQHQDESFLDLLRGLDRIEGIQRYRISSIEPNLLTDEIIDFVAHSRAFLPHFHIPLQAGSDHVLQLMHRHYDTDLYRNKLLKIKSAMPDACIAADVMAGFNGENEEEFRKALAFIDSIPISYLHVFTYSDRPGTAALRLAEKVPVAIRHEHTARLLELSEKKHNAFIQSQLGKCRPVLWESTPHSSLMLGWTDNYIRVCRPYDPTLVNTIENVILTHDNIVKEAASD